MDGVIANFTKPCCEQYGVSYPKETEFLDTWLDKTCKIDNNKQGQRLVDKCNGYSFWFNLETYPWSKTLHDIIDKSGKQWIYLTKPTQDAFCYAGKHDFIQYHFKDARQHLWIANTDKSMMCRDAGDLLIDDKVKNCNNWTKAGGTVYHWTEVTPDWPVALINKRLKDIENLINK